MQAVPASPAPPMMTGVRDERSKEIDRTKTGLVLLAVATLLSWIPVIQLLGLVIGAIAVILILLGTSAFGSRHVYFVWASVFVFCVATVALVGLAASFAGTIRALPIETSGPETTAQLLAAFDTLLYGSLVIVFLLSLCSALIAFELEDVPGRILLAAGVAAQIAISVSLLVLVVMPLVHHSIEEAFATTPPNLSIITAAGDQVRSLRGLVVLNSIPTLLFAGGYIWAYRRIASGATPSRGEGPPSPPVPLPPGTP